MIETVSSGACLPSFITQTRVTRGDYLRDMRTLVWVAFFFTIFFVSLEGVEVYNSGLWEYATNMWNLMDWLNFIVFFMVFRFHTVTYRYLPLHNLMDWVSSSSLWSSARCSRSSTRSTSASALSSARPLATRTTGRSGNGR